jgi:thiamine biosynthesis lipoprotein
MNHQNLRCLWVLVAVLCVTGMAPVGESVIGLKKVHLDKSGALQQVFPTADQVLELRHLLSSEETTRIENRLGKRLEEGGFFLYVGMSNGTPIGYAAIANEIGKVKPITHIVGVTPEGTVSEVAVMIYRESHGEDVTKKAFMAQYEGKSLEDPIRVRRDIINIAGSTLSAHAICRGVRKALAVVEVVFLRQSQDELEARIENAQAVIPAAVEISQPSGHESGGVRIEREIMGTVCTIEAFEENGSLQGKDLEAVVEAALDEISHWDQVLSNWRPDTPLSQLNAALVGEPFRPGDELLAWLENAQNWSRETGGQFDPALGSLVKAWKLQSREPTRPDAETLDAARSAAGMSHLLVNKQAHTVTRLHEDTLLDPGASGKGYALDRAADLLRSNGVHRALLSFRSTLLAMDPPPGKTAWTVPIVHDGSGGEVAQIDLVAQALSVSGGSTMRAFKDGEALRGHVLDPQTGVPVDAARLAWVVHASAAASDSLATALLVGGPALPAIEGAHGGFQLDGSTPMRTWPASR